MSISSDFLFYIVLHISGLRTTQPPTPSGTGNEL